MSRPSCDSCTELRERAPEFVMNGVTDNVAASLMNYTGVSFRESNCEDLKDVLDCLIGRKVQEIETMDVCDWKEFMSDLGGNLYETLKAMVWNECSIWWNLCQRIEATTNPPMKRYGVRPYATQPPAQLGTVNVKNGVPLVTFWEDDTQNSIGIGIEYGTLALPSCDNSGNVRTGIYLYAFMHNCIVDASAQVGDVLWYADKAAVQAATGWPDWLWYDYTRSSWIWYDAAMSDGRYMWLQLTVDENKMGPNYLTIVFAGTSYPQTGLSQSVEVQHHFPDYGTKRY